MDIIKKIVTATSLLKYAHIQLLAILLICVGCTKERSEEDLLIYLKSKADYIHEINGFYIVSSDHEPRLSETTQGTTAKDIFDHSVRLFSNFLDQDGDGVLDADRIALSEALKNEMLFVSGKLRFVNKISAAKAVEGNGLYAMSMQTNKWPYIKDYNGTGWSIDKLSSSTWRPENFNALWEEVFHTITEAYSRSDTEFTFETSGSLRQFMEADIAAGTYDISEQNKEENGNYDKVTATNEYIHQIWAIQFAGHENILNEHQTKALEFMKAKNVPMALDASYNQLLGTKIK